MNINVMKIIYANHLYQLNKNYLCDHMKQLYKNEITSYKAGINQLIENDALISTLLHYFARDYLEDILVLDDKTATSIKKKINDNKKMNDNVKNEIIISINYLQTPINKRVKNIFDDSSTQHLYDILYILNKFPAFFENLFMNACKFDKKNTNKQIKSPAVSFVFTPKKKSVEKKKGGKRIYGRKKKRTR